MFLNPYTGSLSFVFLLSFSRFLIFFILALIFARGQLFFGRLYYYCFRTCFIFFILSHPGSCLLVLHQFVTKLKIFIVQQFGISCSSMVFGHSVLTFPTLVISFLAKQSNPAVQNRQFSANFYLTGFLVHDFNSFIVLYSKVLCRLAGFHSNIWLSN